MNGDRIKLLYEKFKNTTNKIDKQNLLVELGDVIVTYGSDKATKLDFIVMYCASVERADPHVVDFILKYDYKKHLVILTRLGDFLVNLLRWRVKLRMFFLALKP